MADISADRQSGPSLVLALGELGRHASDLAETGLLERAGIRLRSFRVLAHLATEGPQPQLALSAGLRIDSATMVAIVDDLEERELVVRTVDRSDRRRRRVALTQHGLDVLAAASDVLNEFDERLLELVDSDVHADLRASILTWSRFTCIASM